ncbi:general stress protein [Tundrisphaera lichenicola]|uniref:general stress protein n=1 Tax=Tundrisphaera lichenicola TaxID=2029860 RepID=UPI003EBF0CED
MHTVVGLFNQRESAEQAIHRLISSGVDRHSISIAMKDVREAAEISEATDTNDLSAEGATAGAVSGAGVGALVGIALVGSTVLLPGLGTFLIGGPIAAALTGAGIGAASGGLIGGLIGAGIPEEEAHHYASGIESGGIFVSANVPDNQVAEARRIFDEEGSSRTYAP